MATVVEKGQSVRTVYLPKGSDWYDFYTRENMREAPPFKFRWIGRHAFVYPGGAILPMADGLTSISQRE